MKLFEKIQNLVHKTPKVEPEIFLSLILDESYIQAGAWIVDEGKKVRIMSSTSERAVSPTWEDRIRMVDHAIGKLEEETGSTKLSKVVFGLGERFLTSGGDIEKSVRPNLKQLTKLLALTPLGFVPLSTSIAHFLRKTEGIPTSVILIGVTETDLDISIYRVGRLAFSTTVKRTESEGDDIENGLKACTDADVLPSRILLYGADDIRIEELKSLLLRHQWTARANFLHYPKIELFPFEHMIDTVVEAGANEITHELQEDEHKETLDSTVPEVGEREVGGENIGERKKVAEKDSLAEEPHLVKKEEKGKTHMVVVQPEMLGFHESSDVGGAETNFPEMKQEMGAEEPVENPLEFDEAEKENLLQKSQEHQEEKSPIDEAFRDRTPRTSNVHMPVQMYGGVLRLGKKILKRIPKAGFAIVIISFIVIFGGFIGVTRYLPRATVTLAVLPKTITLSDTVIIDPQAAGIDTEKKIIPAKKLEKVVSGEKTVPATGKKKIGDPAKGTVTILNKTEGAAYSLKKGTVISTGSLQFTLDADVSVASAAMSLSGDQLTFGKTTTTVTAVAVGTEGNIDANKEFSVKEYANSILVARNEKAFSGGTSKEVTVVSRADTDTLLKSLTADLIEKAKAELTQSVSGKEKMIDQTVKTTVKEKRFVEEIDQEAKDLHGSLTVSVSAYTYNEEDIKSLLSGVSEKDIPPGYSINPGRTTVAIGDITIAKDGKMTTKATLSSGAIPTIDATSVKKSIAGKKLTAVESELKLIPGVASAEFTFQSTWKKDVLPINPDHISVSVITVE